MISIFLILLVESILVRRSREIFSLVDVVTVLRADLDADACWFCCGVRFAPPRPSDLTACFLGHRIRAAPHECESL
jgi:hypothetical protein